jgi:hypothetical protein
MKKIFSTTENFEFLDTSIATLIKEINTLILLNCLNESNNCNNPFEIKATTHLTMHGEKNSITLYPTLVLKKPGQNSITKRLMIKLTS